MQVPVINGEDVLQSRKKGEQEYCNLRREKIGKQQRGMTRHLRKQTRHQLAIDPEMRVRRKRKKAKEKKCEIYSR